MVQREKLVWVWGGLFLLILPLVHAYRPGTYFRVLSCLLIECIMNIHYVNFNPYYNSQMFKNDSYLSMTVCHYVSQQERKRIKTIFKVFSSKALKVARFSREKLKKSALCKASKQRYLIMRSCNRHQGQVLFQVQFLYSIIERVRGRKSTGTKAHSQLELWAK